MKRTNKYEEVNRLPPSALSIENFAQENGFSASYVYKMVERNQGSALKDMGKRIVVFQGYNFIVPLNGKK